MGITVEAKSSIAKYDSETGKVHIIEEVAVAEIGADSMVRGYLEVGDVIKSITVDGTESAVNRIHNVVDSMLSARVGSNVIINIERDGEEKSVVIPIVESMLKENK